MERGTRRLGTWFVGVALLAAALSVAAAPAPKKAGAGNSGGKAAKLARGEYLATTMGCNDCHTPGTLFGGPDFARRLAGSEVGWKGPWGISFARNLTPDLETGIGYWSEDELVNALRTGLKNDGKPMLPPMPWPNCTRLTDEDIHALAGYLLSLPPVKHKVPDALPPGGSYSGPVIEMPAPGAWDAPTGAPADKK